MDEIRTEVVSNSDKYTADDSSDGNSDIQGTVLWPRRSLLYRIGFLVLVPLFVIFLLGFSCPFWMTEYQIKKFLGHYNDVEMVDVSVGLWRVCSGLDFSHLKDCVSVPSTPYIRACQAMLCLCLIFTIFSLIFGLYENCATGYETEDGVEPRTKRPEVNAIIAGIFGMIGIIQYGVMLIGQIKGGNVSVQWAFPLTAASVTGIIICGILMAVANPLVASSPGYPGQVMSLSIQDSNREPSAQDRLVYSSGISPTSRGNGPGAMGNTLYGITTESPETRERTVMPRSDSAMSSHVSSPDIYTAVSNEPGLPQQNNTKNTHVVETYDVYVHASNGPKGQKVKQSLQNKAAQRRSWHFDDRNGAYVVPELANSRQNSAYQNVDTNGNRVGEGPKPPVPPRRDKMGNPTVPTNRSSQAKSLHPIPDESTDLMVLDDPVVKGPAASGAEAKAEEKAVSELAQKRRSTNPFIEENIEQLAAKEDTNKKAPKIVESGPESWENQPWPDPPSMSEMYGTPSSTAATSGNASPVEPNDETASTATNASADSVPEGLQYQPQNSTSLTRKKRKEAPVAPPFNGSNEQTDSTSPDPLRQQKRLSPQGPPVSARPNRPSGKPRKANRAPPPPPEPKVPILKEYDNPLFKSQQQHAPREEFTLHICDSTSFVNPQPEPPPYSVVETAIRGESPPKYKRQNPNPHIYARSATIDTSDPSVQYQKQLSKELVREAKRHARLHKSPKPAHPNRPSVPRDQTQQNTNEKVVQNGGIKSRPRQVKRENQQRRAGYTESTYPSPSQKGYYSSNPDLATRSPVLTRGRREGSAGPRDMSSPKTEARYSHHSDYRTNTYESEAAKRVPPPVYRNRGTKVTQWDSDL